MASLLLLLLLGAFLLAAGFGILMGAGGGGKGGGGPNVGKIVTIFVVGLVFVAWLAQPNTGRDLSAIIAGAWGNFLIGVVRPVVAILTQLAMVAAVGAALFFIIRAAVRRQRYRRR